MTLKERLGTRHNRLNAIRLFLASLVILGHAWPLTGASGPSLEFWSVVAVNGFFILSGYLIAESRARAVPLATPPAHLSGLPGQSARRHGLFRPPSPP